LSVSAVTGKCVRVHVAASHKFCIHCRDIRVSERERERDGVELDTGDAEGVYEVHLKSALFMSEVKVQVSKN